MPKEYCYSKWKVNYGKIGGDPLVIKLGNKPSIVNTEIQSMYEANVLNLRQSACLVINPITVESIASLFNCTSADRASDTMMGPK